MNATELFVKHPRPWKRCSRSAGCVDANQRYVDTNDEMDDAIIEIINACRPDDDPEHSRLLEVSTLEAAREQDYRAERLCVALAIFGAMDHSATEDDVLSTAERLMAANAARPVPNQKENQ